MQLKNNLAVLANVGILALLACQSAMGLSLPAATTYAEHRETRAYAGLQWFIGETSVAMPKVFLGLRTTTTDLCNKVKGYDLSYTYSLETSTSDALRAGYLDEKFSRLGYRGPGLFVQERNGPGLCRRGGLSRQGVWRSRWQKGFWRWLGTQYPALRRRT